MEEESSLPTFAYSRDGFSKTRTAFKLLMDQEIGELSTFQAQTVKATGIYVFFSLFLRSSRRVW
jgi:hypothetical protein